MLQLYQTHRKTNKFYCYSLYGSSHQFSFSELFFPYMYFHLPFFFRCRESSPFVVFRFETELDWPCRYVSVMLRRTNLIRNQLCLATKKTGEQQDPPSEKKLRFCSTAISSAMWSLLFERRTARMIVKEWFQLTCLCCRLAVQRFVSKQSQLWPHFRSNARSESYHVMLYSILTSIT